MDKVQYPLLSASEKRDAPEVAERQCGEDNHLLEKNTWIVATLRVLFEAPFGRHLVFKGGTSLSKVWRAIRRFSEDIDITYDIRGFAPDLVAGGDDEGLPPTRSQQRRWTRAIRPRLAEWVPTPSARSFRLSFTGLAPLHGSVRRTSTSTLDTNRCSKPAASFDRRSKWTSGPVRRASLHPSLPTSMAHGDELDPRR